MHPANSALESGGQQGAFGSRPLTFPPIAFELHDASSRSFPVGVESSHPHGPFAMSGWAG